MNGAIARLRGRNRISIPAATTSNKTMGCTTVSVGPPPKCMLFGSNDSGPKSQIGRLLPADSGAHPRGNRLEGTMPVP